MTTFPRYIRVNGNVYERVASDDTDDTDALKRQPSVDAFINLVMQQVSPAGYQPLPKLPGYQFHATPGRVKIKLASGAYKSFYWKFLPGDQPNTLAVEITSQVDPDATKTIKIDVDNPTVDVMAGKIVSLAQTIVYDLWNF